MTEENVENCKCNHYDTDVEPMTTSVNDDNNVIGAPEEQMILAVDCPIAKVMMSVSQMNISSSQTSSSSEDSESNPPSNNSSSPTTGLSYTPMNVVSHDQNVDPNPQQQQQTNTLLSTHPEENNSEEIEDICGLTDTIVSSRKYSATNENVTSSRFNPFHADIFIEDDHFLPPPFVPKSKSTGDIRVSNSYFQAVNPRDSMQSPFSDTYTDDDTTSLVSHADISDLMGNDIKWFINEQHFSHPTEYFGLTPMEELEMTIYNYKSAIKNLTSENISKQGELLKKLVELQLQLKELKDNDVHSDKELINVLGHEFVQRVGYGGRRFCDMCCGIIIGFIHYSYRCTGCAYRCHDKCRNSITRPCPASSVYRVPYTHSICPEIGLAKQRFQCGQCKKQVSLHGGYYEQARLCDYSGRYFCYLCHWNDTMVIPARVLHNWDFEPRLVSRHWKRYLRLVSTKAVLRIENIGPNLFYYIEDLGKVKTCREDLMKMKVYLTSCRFAQSERILLQLKDRQHFVESSDMYSLQDLMDINSGQMQPFLDSVVETFTKHIYACQLCHAKGFVCELCNSSDIVFPFDPCTSLCGECNATYHRDCFTSMYISCPRCDRRKQRQFASK